MVQNETLSIKQQKAVRVLIESRNITVACKRLHIGRATIYRWLQEPLFLQELQKAESVLLDEVSRSLLAGAETMLEILYQIAIEGDETNVRRNAANDWLNLVLKVRDFSVWDRRITAIEESIRYEQQE